MSHCATRQIVSRAVESAKEDDKPAFWGSWTRNPDTDPILKHAAWERVPNRYGPWASGNTQHPLTKEEAAQLKAGIAPQADLAQPEPAPAPRQRRAAPRATAGRGE